MRKIYFLYFSCIFRSERPYFNFKYFFFNKLRQIIPEIRSERKIVTHVFKYSVRVPSTGCKMTLVYSAWRLPVWTYIHYAILGTLLSEPVWMYNNSWNKKWKAGFTYFLFSFWKRQVHSHRFTGADPTVLKTGCQALVYQFLPNLYTNFTKLSNTPFWSTSVH
jgi:hypothetical protein